jgi:hypothetical protein
MMRSLKQAPKFFRRQPSVTGDAAHRERVNGIGPWNHQPRDAVRHDDVAAGPDDSIAKFLKHTDGVLVPDARKSGHNSNGHFGFADFEQFRLVRFCRQPFLDRLANIL